MPIGWEAHHILPSSRVGTDNGLWLHRNPNIEWVCRFESCLGSHSVWLCTTVHTNLFGSSGIVTEVHQVMKKRFQGYCRPMCWADTQIYIWEIGEVICPCGGIGRHAGLRNQFVRVQVRLLSRAPNYAVVVELADTRDLKSLGRNTVPVQVRSAAPLSFSK